MTIIRICGIISNVVVNQPHIAGVAQSVVQLIRNQQVVCSSHITSSKKGRRSVGSPAFFVVCLTHEEHTQIRRICNVCGLIILEK